MQCYTKGPEDEHRYGDENEQGRDGCEGESHQHGHHAAEAHLHVPHRDVMAWDGAERPSAVRAQVGLFADAAAAISA